jgi:hypothetical protein
MATTTCGGSLHHRNYGRVNAGGSGGGDEIPGQAGSAKFPLVNLRTSAAPANRRSGQRDRAGWRLGSVDFWSTATSRSKSVTSSKPL